MTDRDWTADLSQTLPRHGEIVTNLRREVGESDRWRWLTISCSLSAVSISVSCRGGFLSRQLTVPRPVATADSITLQEQYRRDVAVPELVSHTYRRALRASTVVIGGDALARPRGTLADTPRRDPPPGCVGRRSHRRRTGAHHQPAWMRCTPRGRDRTRGSRRGVRHVPRSR